MMFAFIDFFKIKISRYVNVLGRKQARLFLNENKAHGIFWDVEVLIRQKEYILHVLQ